MSEHLQQQEEISLLGIKLSKARLIVDDLPDPNWTTEQVCSNYVKPLTVDWQISYCDLLTWSDDPDVGRAEVFISHAWSYTYADVIETLTAHFGAKHQDPYLWFDIFTVNQHQAATTKLSSQWWMGSFKSAIQQIGHCVLVLDTWRAARPLSRAWCVFEMYAAVETANTANASTAHTTSCNFEIALFPGQEEAFQYNLEQIVSKPDFERLIKTLFHIDLRQCECYWPDDKEMIFKEVRKLEGGFEQVNSVVCGHLGDWGLKLMERGRKKGSLLLSVAERSFINNGTTPALYDRR